MASDTVGWIRAGVIRSPLLPAALLGLLAAFVFVWRLGERDLWAPDETRNAQVAREMVLSNHLGVPSLNGEAYPDRPPLHAWAMAATCLVLGADSEVSARLPGAIAGAGIVFLFFFLGRKALGSRAALLSGMVFATAVGAIAGARVATSDMLTCFFHALAMLAFLRAREEAASAAWYLLAAAGVAGGMLTCGAEGVLVPFAALAAFSLWSRRTTPRWAIGASVAAVLGAAVCFGVLFVASRGTDTFPRMVAAQLRCFDRGDAGFAFQFLWVVPIATLPWIFFLPAAVAQFSRDPQARRGPAGYLLCWGGAALAWAVVFGSKNILCAIVALPPLAGIIGLFWHYCLAVDATERLRWRVGLPFLAFVLALPIAGFVLYGQTREAFPPFGGIAMGYGSVLIFLSSVLVIFIFWRQTFCRFASVGVSSLIAVGFAVVFVVPKINEVKSERAFYESVRVRVPAASELRTVCMPDASHIYYSGRSRVPNIQSEEDLERYLASSGEVFCIMDYDDYLTHRLNEVKCLNLVYKERAGRKTLAVVTNRMR